jgi:hypothetical protein
VWTKQAAVAFVTLKCALFTAPILHLSYFKQPFTVECYASGFDAVLHQGSGAIAFFNRPFAPQHLKLAAYERELIDLVQAVRHW